MTKLHYLALLLVIHEHAPRSEREAVADALFSVRRLFWQPGPGCVPRRARLHGPVRRLEFAACADCDSGRLRIAFAYRCASCGRAISRRYTARKVA